MPLVRSGVAVLLRLAWVVTLGDDKRERKKHATLRECHEQVVV